MSNSLIVDKALQAATQKMREICDTPEPCEDILRYGYKWAATAVIEAYVVALKEAKV